MRVLKEIINAQENWRGNESYEVICMVFCEMVGNHAGMKGSSPTTPRTYYPNSLKARNAMT